VVGLRSFILGSHVASTVNGRKGEGVFIFHAIACNLAVDDIVLPSSCYGPVEGCDPVLCSKSGHGAI